MQILSGAEAFSADPAVHKVESAQRRVVAITKYMISDQDQVQAIYFDLRSDHGQIIFVIFLLIEKIKI